MRLRNYARESHPSGIARSVTRKHTDHYRFMLKVHLSHIDLLDTAIVQLGTKTCHGLEPFRQGSRLVTTMPGICTVIAEMLVAEIGIDMSRFATLGHLLSWACNDESAGKRHSPKLRTGGKWPKNTFAQAVLGSCQGPRRLSTGAVPAYPISTRGQESDHRRSSIHAHGHMAHAARRH